MKLKLYEAIDECFKTKATYLSHNDIVTIEISYNDNYVFLECNSEDWGYAFNIYKEPDYKKVHKELEEIKDFEFIKKNIL